MAAACGTCKARWTGTRVEHCASCHQSFTGTRAGDKHTTVVSKYSVIRHPGGKLERVPDDSSLPVGAKLLSIGNSVIRCLTPEEMLEKGMVRNSYGLWSTGDSTFMAE